MLAVQEAETAYLVRKDVPAALGHYRVALPGTGDPLGVTFNIGRCLKELDRRDEALDTFLALLDHDDLPRDIRQLAERMVAELVQMPQARLTVECDVDDARIRIGLAEPRRCPVKDKPVLAGSIEVHGIGPTDTRVSASVKLVAGGLRTLHLTFTAHPPEPASKGPAEAGEPPARSEMPPGSPPHKQAAQTDHRERRGASSQGEVVPDPLSGVVREIDEPHDRAGIPLDSQVAVGAASPRRSVHGPSLLMVGGGVALLIGSWYSLDAAANAFGQASQSYHAYESSVDSGEIAKHRRMAEAAKSEGEIYRAAGYGMLGVGATALLGGTVWQLMEGSERRPAVSIQPAAHGFALGGWW